MIFCLLLAAGGQTTAASEARWLTIASLKDGENVLDLDLDMETLGLEIHGFEGWFKNGVNGITQLAHKARIDCVNRKFGVIDALEYSEDGSLKTRTTYLPYDMREAVPDSLGEDYINAGCNAVMTMLYFGRGTAKDREAANRYHSPAEQAEFFSQLTGPGKKHLNRKNPPK